MVFLTMTTLMVEALEEIQEQDPAEKGEVNSCNEGSSPQASYSSGEQQGIASIEEVERKDGVTKKQALDKTLQESKVIPDSKGDEEISDPSLKEPKVGNPISHSQVIDLSKRLKPHNRPPCRLEDLLKGARIYAPPPPTKKEPTSEYKALMARLRREEELRAYERMTNPPAPMETFAQRFPASSAAHAFSMNHEPAAAEDDEVIYADINRQMALILNVLVSIIACAGAIWVVARWWSTPVRLALSMSGSALVGVAEVVVYSGYIRRVGEAKGKAKRLEEVKEVVQTWIIGREDDAANENSSSAIMTSKSDADSVKARRRKKEML